MSGVTRESRAFPAACHYCGAESAGAGHFCAKCGRIQAVPAGTDYFTFIGLPRKLRIDETQLETTFYELSRQFHPDYFMKATAAERQASIDRSSALNDAYRTLRDRVARAKYLLSLYGYKEEEKRAPADLLEEVFELNMQIEELKAAKKMADDEGVSETRTALTEALTELEKKIAQSDDQLSLLFDEWDRATDEDADGRERKSVLDRISELLSRRSYIQNLVREIKEEF